MWREGITNAEFKKWPKKELVKFSNFVTSNLECKPGDPADLQKYKKTVTSCTLSRGTPTDYTTTSWNDPNVWDLHRPEILPYREDTAEDRHPMNDEIPAMRSTESTYILKENEMTSGEPEQIDKSEANRRDQIYSAKERYRMLHENPATVCMWFFIRQLINMDVMRRTSYPVAYETWFARKFEFQDRGSVHEHAVKALIFLWIKAEVKGKDAKDLSEDDFEEITCRTDKLCMSCESGMVRQIMVRRIYTRIRRYIADPKTSDKDKEQLQPLQEIFRELKHWIKNVDKELQKFAESVGGAPQQQQEDRTSTEDNNNMNLDDNNDDEFDDEAFSSFQHIDVAYEDPKLAELKRWTTEKGRKDLKEMIESYKDWILLGRHSENMMIAFANARIHSYDNTNSNYPNETAGSGVFRQGREDVANRITRLRRKLNRLTHIKIHPIDVTMYEDCHRLHVSTSQLHCCCKYCIRYKTKPTIKEDTQSTNTSQTENPQPQDSASGKATIRNKRKKAHLIKICRFRAPWGERICKVCFKDNKDLRYTVCHICRVVKKISSTKNAQNFPYRPQTKTTITYSIRFDRENRFHSARPEINVRRNNPWVTTHNRDATLINGGNTDLQLTFHLGRIISYLYSYLAKKEVTKADVQRHLNASLRALSDVLESSYVVTLQRAVSAAIAGRTFSTQAAWWQILGLPICDSNIKRDIILINSRSKRLNIKPNTMKGEQDKKLVSRDYYDAYAQREEMLREGGDKFYQHVQEYCLEQFVEECYHQSRKGKLFIATRNLRHKKYSRYDPALKFADKKYPFVHMVQFPELFDKRLKNGDPKGDMYWRWCQLQLTIHKPWKTHPLGLWGDTYKSIREVPKSVFIKKWHEFVDTTEQGKEVQNRFNRHRAERTACKDHLLDLDKYLEQGWEVDRDYQLGDIVGDLTGSGTSKAEEILQTGRDWEAELKARNQVRETYTDVEITEA